MIRKSFALVAVTVALLAALPAAAEQHVVSAPEVAARLQAAESARQQNLAVLDGFLASPEAAAAAARVKADPSRLRASLGALGDAELADLAARVAAVQSDPVAGLDPDIRMLLVIFLIVAIVILVLQAVD